MKEESHHCEVCGKVIDSPFYEFCHRCRKILCFDLTGEGASCAKPHPSHLGYYYCPDCLDDCFLCKVCGSYKTRRGRFPLKDHLCEDCAASPQRGEEG